MILINSHYVHEEDIPRIQGCHKNLEGLLRRIFPSSLVCQPSHAHTNTRKNLSGSRDYCACVCVCMGVVGCVCVPSFVFVSASVGVGVRACV